MKTQITKFKYISIMLLVFTQAVTAQKFEEKKTESFKVSKDVVIDINTNYTDVVIETWNKNTVSVVAKISVEGDSITKEDAEKYFKKWHFEALGNKEKVTIKTENEFLFIHSIGDSSVPNIDFIMPEISINNLDILDSFKVVMPRINELVFEVLEDAKMDSLDFHFDFDKYKTDKEYMKKFQEKAKAQRILIKKRMDADSTLRKVRIVELKKNLQRVKEEMKLHQKEFELVRVKEMATVKKEMAKFHKDRASQIKRILERRHKVKLKKTIYIKVPKDATFKTDVRYGTLSLPSK